MILDQEQGNLPNALAFDIISFKYKSQVFLTDRYTILSIS